MSINDETVNLTLQSGRVLKALIRHHHTQNDTQNGAQSGLKPVIMLFGGFQNAAYVLDLVQPDLPVILASFDYPFDPPRHLKFPQGLKLAPHAKRTIHETIEGIELLMAHLKTRSDVDRQKISIVGASLGAPFAAIAGATIPEIKGVVLIHGFGKVPQVIAHQFLRKWEKKHGAWVRPFARLLGVGAWAYIGIQAPEAAVAALRPTQSILMIAAERDSFVPKAATDALWTAIQSSHANFKRITHPGDHLQPGSEALIGQLLNRVKEWGRERDLL